MLPRAVHSLRDLLCLFLLFVIILAIFCISLFSGGTLHGRCIVSPNNTFATAWNARQTHYLQQHLADKTTANYADVFQRDSPVGELKIPEQFCSNDESCGVGFECSCRPPPGDLGDRSYLAGRPGCLRIPYGRMGETNNGEVVTMRYGYMGYNNFAQAFFTVFQVCTLSNWGEIMDATMQAHGVASCLVFIVIVIGMRYWIMNVAVAIIPSVYLTIQQKRTAERIDAAMGKAEQALLNHLMGSAAHEDEVGSGDDSDEEAAAAQGKAKKNLRKSKAKDALVDKLGDLSSCNPRELSQHIRKTFEQFDEDGSGEISAGELAEAFRAMGMEIPDDEVEEMAADADMDGDGSLGIEEFEDMVKKMISTVREKEPETDYLRIKDEAPLFLGVFPISETYFARNTQPLGQLSLAVARLMAAPKTIDECGVLVPWDVIFEAKRRNLVVEWGPKTRQWSLVADRGGASIGMETRKEKTKNSNAIKAPSVQEAQDKAGFKEMFPSNSPIPGGEGVTPA
ncbi:MAG: ion transporter, partial [Promethearchaeia archaeon]